MSDSSKRVIIVGAGVAGLTLAYLMSCDGNKVVVVERESQVGGLARSFAYDGYVFDIGPHRFHTDDLGVRDFIYKILGNDFIAIERQSGVWMFDHYFNWPLNFLSILKMPFSNMLSVAIDLLRRNKYDGNSFEDYIITHYGKTLYKIFFKPYTEKFIKMPCSEISRDWAITGLDRAVIDKKIKLDNLSDIAKSLFFRRPPITFIYPKSGGINVFSENLRKMVINNGGSIFLSSEVHEIVKSKNEIKAVIIGGQAYQCDMLIWTGPVTGILRLLGYDEINMEYLALILYNFHINHTPLIKYQWCYYGSGDIPFNRISIPVLFNSVLAPEGRSGLCVEVTSRESDRIWNNPETIEPEIREWLVKVGVIKDREAVLGLNIEKISNAYPVYTLNYAEKRKRIFEIVGTFNNLRLLGRTGTFWYNNMDHSIRAAMDLYNEIK